MAPVRRQPFQDESYQLTKSHSADWKGGREAEMLIGLRVKGGYSFFSFFQEVFLSDWSGKTMETLVRESTAPRLAQFK